MPFPQTLDELRHSGYKFENHGQCRGCSAEIEWYRTPNGKMIPMDVHPDLSVEAHWGKCEARDQFKKNQELSGSKITSATLNMDWLKEQAKGCHCVVCKKLTGR